MAEVLEGRMAVQAAICEAGRENLFYIPVGRSAGAAPEALDQDRLRAVLEEVQGGFDRVVISQPAAGRQQRHGIAGPTHRVGLPGVANADDIAADGRPRHS